MKKKNILLLALPILLAGCGNGNANQTKGNSNNEIIATVDGENINYNDYIQDMDFLSLYISAQQNMKNPVTDLLVESKVIENDMKKNNIKVTKDQIDKEHDQIVEDFGGKENFEKILKDYNITEEQIKRQAERKAAYTAYEKWFSEQNQPTEEEVKDHYDGNIEDLKRVKAKHILLNDEETAKEVKAKIDKGEDWNALTKEYSQDDYNKDQGGDLGEFLYKDMVEEFSKKAFSMKEGEISDPVETPFGWHIIKVEDVTTPEEIKEDIKKDLILKKYYKHIEDLKKKAKVEVVDQEAAEFIKESYQQNNEEKESNEDKDTETKEDKKVESKK